VQICEHKQQRLLRSNRLQRFTDLTQHTRARRAQNLPFKHLALFAVYERGKLHQPSGRLFGQDADDRLSFRPPAQLPQRFQHRVVSFQPSIAFHALAVRDANPRRISPCPTLEFVGQCSLAYACLPSDENDLPFAAPCFAKVAAQLGQCWFAAHDPFHPTCGQCTDGAVVDDGSHKLISPFGQRFDECRRIRPVSQRSSDFQDVLPEYCGVHIGGGPERF